MKSDIVEKQPDESFKPVILRILLESEKELFALDAMFNHGVMVADATYGNLPRLLSMHKQDIPNWVVKSEVAFEDLTKRLLAFKTERSGGFKT